MNKNRFAQSLVNAAGIICVLTASVQAYGYGAPLAAPQSASPASSAVQTKSDYIPSEDFAGLIYTDEQRAEIAHIHQNVESRKALVAKDKNLSTSDKDEMIQNYTRLEFGMVFKVLTPEQRRQVNQRARARRAADVAALRTQAPHS